MKTYKKLLSIALALILLGLTAFGQPEMVEAASKKYTAAKTAYRKYMRYKDVKGYKIIDLDKNGIPELLVMADYEYKVYTYDYSRKKMIRLAHEMPGKYSGTGGLKYYASKKAFSIANANTGGSITRYYRVSGTKVKLLGKFEFSRSWIFTGHGKEYTYAYYYNGKKVSQKTYERKEAQLQYKKYRQI